MIIMIMGEAKGIQLTLNGETCINDFQPKLCVFRNKHFVKI